MKIYDSIKSLDEVQDGLVLSIGNFDGVHLGHQEIIKVAKDAQQKAGIPALAVLTFDPHPVMILHPERAPGILTPLDLKRYLLKECGVDLLIVLKDSLELLNLSPKDFVDEFLIRHLKPSVVVEGPNFNFGYGRSGNIETLEKLASERDFGVVVVPAKQMIVDNDRPTATCSSSLIRNLLEKGEVATAAKALGRPYKLIGETVPGRGIGKRIGFPTANIDPVEQIIPAEGVYAGFVEVGTSFDDVCISTERMWAAFSIGRAKTFVSDHPLLVEAHILDCNVQDLYDKWLSMDFIKKLRSQKRFKTEQELKDQIAEDCEEAKKILSDFC